MRFSVHFDDLLLGSARGFFVMSCEAFYYLKLVRVERGGVKNRSRYPQHLPSLTTNSKSNKKTIKKSADCKMFWYFLYLIFIKWWTSDYNKWRQMINQRVKNLDCDLIFSFGDWSTFFSFFIAWFLQVWKWLQVR